MSEGARDEATAKIAFMEAKLKSILEQFNKINLKQSDLDREKTLQTLLHFAETIQKFILDAKKSPSLHEKLYKALLVIKHATDELSLKKPISELEESTKRIHILIKKILQICDLHTKHK